jgi:O-antigen biosynthesis protein WbqP
VVTGLPNHPSGQKQPGFRAGTREAWEGLDVWRAWLYATPRKNLWTRLWNHLSFGLCALPAAWRAGPVDAVLVSVPPLFIGVTAWLVARLRRAPLVLDCRDDWPVVAVALGEMRQGAATGALQALAASLYHRAARVIAVTPGMLRSLAARGVDQGRLVLITNGADTDVFRPAPSVEGAPAAPVTVLYAGTHGLIHGMDALIDAAVCLQGRPEIRFLLVGDGVAKPALEARARSLGLRNVEFQPSLPPERLARVVARADVCVATTRNHPFCGETIPVKLFDYLASGRPVVAAVSGDAAELVAASGGGEVVPPGDGAGLARALAGLADDPARRRVLGEAGARYVERNYSRRALGRRLAVLLEEVAARSRGRPVRPEPAGLAGTAKRVADMAVAALLLALLAPVIVLIAIAVRWDCPGPALFRQRRVGRGSAEFIMFKFRTMKVGTPDLASHLMGPGPSYLTRLGRWLRRSSLDELPQLWNVLRGEMSLVGPRPALFNQDDLIAARQRLDVDALRPGVTGWAQIHGRDDIPLDLKVELDCYYRQHASPALDLVILARTVGALFSSRGVY